MNCVVLAGGVPKENDPLFPFTQGKPKALLDVCGKPMVRWVIDALLRSKHIDRVVLVGLSSIDGLDWPELVVCIPNHGELLRNALAGIKKALELEPDSPQAILCSADIPLITPLMVDDFISQCTDLDIAIHYCIVPRSLMERRFPKARRSFVHFSDAVVSGGDIFAIDPHLALSNQELWEDLIGRRKSPMKQARRIGLGVVIKLLLRRLSIAEAEIRVSNALGLKGRVVIANYAELGMDVDKPHQLEICLRELSDR